MQNEYQLTTQATLNFSGNQSVSLDLNFIYPDWKLNF